MFWRVSRKDAIFLGGDTDFYPVKWADLSKTLGKFFR